MKKYVVLSVNENNDYLYWVPLTCWAWKKFGWEPILITQGDGSKRKVKERFTWLHSLPIKIEKIAPLAGVEGYRSDTITQLSRLYAAIDTPMHPKETRLTDDDYLMTGDIDMIPLSDYWNPDFEKITVWGHDLTGYGHYPICYIGMKRPTWKKVMHLNFPYPDGFQMEMAMYRDLLNFPQAKDPDFYKYWFTDQDIITARLKPFSAEIVSIERGQYPNGYARGRVDRGAWSLSHSEFIDAHLFQQVYHKGREEYFNKTMKLLYEMWPEEDFTWVLKYTDEFRKITGHA